MGALAMLIPACAVGGGGTSSVQGRGSGPWLAASGWPVDRVSATPRQSSPVVCATRARRSSSTVAVSVLSRAR